MRMSVASAILLILMSCFRPSAADSWSEPANVSESPDYNRWACVFGDGDGWHYTYTQGTQGDSKTLRLWCRMQKLDGAWSAPVRVSDVPRTEESQLGRFADGTHFVLFQGRAKLGDEWHYAEQKPDGAWDEAVPFTPDDGHRDLCTDFGRVFSLDAAGTLHLLCQHGEDDVWNMRYYEKPAGKVKFCRFDKDGETMVEVEKPAAGALVDHGSVLSSKDYQLNGSVFATGDGAARRVHCLVNSGRNVGEWRCWYRRWDGKAWSEPQNLCDRLPVKPSGSHAGGIAGLPGGRLVACVACADADKDRNWDIWLLFSDDGGGTWKDPVNVSDTPGLSRTPSMAVTASGDVVVAWEDTTGGGMKIMARRWSKGRLGPSHEFPGRGFTVCVAAHGDVVRAAWHSFIKQGPGKDEGNWEIVTSECRGPDAPAHDQEIHRRDAEGAKER